MASTIVFVCLLICLQSVKAYLHDDCCTSDEVIVIAVSVALFFLFVLGVVLISCCCCSCCYLAKQSNKQQIIVNTGTNIDRPAELAFQSHFGSRPQQRGNLASEPTTSHHPYQFGYPPYQFGYPTPHGHPGFQKRQESTDGDRQSPQREIPQYKATASHIGQSQQQLPKPFARGFGVNPTNAPAVPSRYGSNANTPYPDY